jgi:hypothetical protein
MGRNCSVLGRWLSPRKFRNCRSFCQRGNFALFRLYRRNVPIQKSYFGRFQLQDDLAVENLVVARNCHKCVKYKMERSPNYKSCI